MVCDGKDLRELAKICLGLEPANTLILDVERCQKPKLSSQPSTVLVPSMFLGDKCKLGTDVPHTLNVQQGRYPVLQIICAASLSSWAKHKQHAASTSMFAAVAAELQRVVDQVCCSWHLPVLFPIGDPFLVVGFLSAVSSYPAVFSGCSRGNAAADTCMHVQGSTTFE
jgi:hypothetical protein